MVSRSTEKGPHATSELLSWSLVIIGDHLILQGTLNGAVSEDRL